MHEINVGCADCTLVSDSNCCRRHISYTIFAQTADELDRRGNRACVLTMHTLKPLDSEAVLASARQTSAIVTIEEHNVIGGLASAGSEVVAAACMKEIKLRSLGITDRFANTASQKCLRHSDGLTPQAICAAVCDTLGSSGTITASDHRANRQRRERPKDGTA